MPVPIQSSSVAPVMLEKGTMATLSSLLGCAGTTCPSGSAETTVETDSHKRVAAAAAVLDTIRVLLRLRAWGKNRLLLVEVESGQDVVGR